MARGKIETTEEGRRILADFERYMGAAGQYLKHHASGVLDAAGDARKFLQRLGTTGAPTPGDPAGRPGDVPTSYPGGYRWSLDVGVVSSEFGQRRGAAHEGMDIAADSGVPVHAAAPGTVAYAGDRIGGYGNLVIVRHDQRTMTFYGHASALRVKAGQPVPANQVVALVGSTGRSTGPHLHFEVRQGDRAIDPRSMLPRHARWPAPLARPPVAPPSASAPVRRQSVRV